MNGMTHYTEADLAMASRHIAQGEEHVARQERLVTTLRGKGHPIDAAVELLGNLNAALIEHRTHRDAILVALADAAPEHGGPPLPSRA